MCIYYILFINPNRSIYAYSIYYIYYYHYIYVYIIYSGYMEIYAYIHIYIIYYILRINRYMHILYIETYIIYKLRAREEINGSDRRGPSDGCWCCWMRLVQLIPFPGHIVNDGHFGMTLKRVKNAPQRFGRWYMCDILSYLFKKNNNNFWKKRLTWFIEYAKMNT